MDMDIISLLGTLRTRLWDIAVYNIVLLQHQLPVLGSPS